MSQINDQPAFGQRDVTIVDRQTLFEGFFRVDKVTFKHRLFVGGWSDTICREVFERGDAVAVLPYDPQTDELVLVEQFRIGALTGAQRKDEETSPWLLECIAGMSGADELPTEVATREAEEEAGLKLSGLQPMLNYLSSPGGTSERIHLFAAIVDSRTASGVHGLASENEDIRVCVVKREKALQWLKEGRIDNATTVIALQWLQLNGQSLFARPLNQTP